MEKALDDLLAKVKVIAETSRGELLRQIIDLMYDYVEKEYDIEQFSEEDLEAIYRGKEDVAAGRLITLEESEKKGGFLRKPTNYKELFFKMEATLRKESSLSEEDFERNWGIYKNYHYKNDTDNDIFWKLIKVIFYSGMKAGTVTSKLPALKKYFHDYNKVKDYNKNNIDEIMNDESIIRNRRKILACVENAMKYSLKIKQYGRFATYLESFGDLNDGATLERIKYDLSEFEFLGPKTAYHFMLDLGLKVWKPDRVICRILKRLGMIGNLEDIDRTIAVGRDIADQVGLPIRYIDIVFVKYGQMGGEEPFGLITGICLEKNPRCSVCGILDYCTEPKIR
jgi:DNA-3-methyladenine glycosylase I